MDKSLLRQMLVLHEGLKLKPYLDTVGKTTIGVGRNISDTGISITEAMVLLENDIDRVEKELSQFPWFNDLSDIRRTAIMDMCFNLGLSRMLQFKNMIAALSSKDYVAASAHMLDSTWAQQVGDRAKQLSTMVAFDHG